MKIYTRTGDDGTTQLLGPRRVPKSSARVEAYGTVDELNAALGAARALDTDDRLGAELSSIQTMLFAIGSRLAADTPALLASLDPVTEADIAALERLIDRLDADLPPLRHFILPAGAPLAAQMHFARTVCRRAERRVVALAQDEAVEPHIVHYLNRLADLLFVMARWCNHRAGVAEVEWSPRKPGA